MEVLVLQVFVSLVLVAGALLLFAYSSRQRDLEQGDRLCLAPLDDDTGAPPSPRGPGAIAPAPARPTELASTSDDSAHRTTTRERN